MYQLSLHKSFVGPYGDGFVRSGAARELSESIMKEIFAEIVANGGMQVAETKMGGCLWDLITNLPFFRTKFVKQLVRQPKNLNQSMSDDAPSHTSPVNRTSRSSNEEFHDADSRSASKDSIDMTGAQNMTQSRKENKGLKENINQPTTYDLDDLPQFSSEDSEKSDPDPSVPVPQKVYRKMNSFIGIENPDYAQMAVTKKNTEENAKIITPRTQKSNLMNGIVAPQLTDFGFGSVSYSAGKKGTVLGRGSSNDSSIIRQSSGNSTQSGIISPRIIPAVPLLRPSSEANRNDGSKTILSPMSSAASPLENPFRSILAAHTDQKSSIGQAGQFVQAGANKTEDLEDALTFEGTVQNQLVKGIPMDSPLDSTATSKNTAVQVLSKASFFDEEDHGDNSAHVQKNDGSRAQYTNALTAIASRPFRKAVQLPRLPAFVRNEIFAAGAEKAALQSKSSNYSQGNRKSIKVHKNTLYEDPRLGPLKFMNDTVRSVLSRKESGFSGDVAIALDFANLNDVTSSSWVYDSGASKFSGVAKTGVHVHTHNVVQNAVRGSIVIDFRDLQQSDVYAFAHPMAIALMVRSEEFKREADKENLASLLELHKLSEGVSVFQQRTKPPVGGKMLGSERETTFASVLVEQILRREGDNPSFDKCAVVEWGLQEKSAAVQTRSLYVWEIEKIQEGTEHSNKIRITLTAIVDPGGVLNSRWLGLFVDIKEQIAEGVHLKARIFYVLFRW